MTDECCSPNGGKGLMLAVAALLLALGILGSAYLISQKDLGTKVTVSPSQPNVYVSSTPPDHVIGVSASASQKVAPDLLLISLRVQTEATTAKKSQSDNALVVADLRNKVKALGVADVDLKTSSYEVSPIYDSRYVCPRDGGSSSCHYDSILTGYRTTYRLQVRLTDLTKGGDVIDVASTAGTNQTFTDSISFTLKDETRDRLSTELLKTASLKAKTKAQNIADGLGISVGKVLSASESQSYNYPTSIYAMRELSASAPSEAPTQLSSGDIEVSTSVSVSYSIG